MSVGTFVYFSDVIRNIIFNCCTRRQDFVHHKNSMRRLANKRLLKEIKRIEAQINFIPEKYREVTVRVIPLEVEKGGDRV
jgi:hypothetical protein